MIKLQYEDGNEYTENENLKYFGKVLRNHIRLLEEITKHSGNAEYKPNVGVLAYYPILSLF
jgi:hypothetical protein